MPHARILTYSPPGEPGVLEGKFLQFTWQGREYLIFAARELHRYHNQILAHFLTDNDIPHLWPREDLLEVLDSELKVIGGGRFRLDLARKMLDLWDNSQAYGRFDARRMEENIAAAGQPWSGLEVRIG